MKRLLPSVLILGSRFDLSCDYVIARLRNFDCSYLRLNSEDLSDSSIGLDPIHGILDGRLVDLCFHIDINDLKSIYYRRPVFPRNYDDLENNSVERFKRYQWATLIRNLMIFDKSFWVNHPAATYYAEHKAVQLHIAHEVGFLIPETIITNQETFIRPELIRNGDVVVKGLDTVLLRNGTNETFGFTKFINRASLSNEDINSAPVIFQKPISNKVDIRVTVIGSDIFSASIHLDDHPIQGDWRYNKDNLNFVPFNLPCDIRDMCFLLLRKLGLIYGAIDLALEDNRYYFLEINPTGEWSWLVNSANLPIDNSIAKCLMYSI